jgi:hypothetical protein
VITGGEVKTYVEPTKRQKYHPPGNPVFPWGNGTETDYPYSHPGYEGPTYDIPDDAGR